MLNTTIQKAIQMVEKFKGVYINLEDHIISVPLPKGITEEDVMDDNMIGRWFIDNGFEVSFGFGDIEYQTQGKWTNYRGWNRQSGHRAHLRNRIILIATW